MMARLFTLVIIATLAVSGCTTAAGEPQTTPSAAGDGPATTGADSYAFTVATLDGETFDGHSLAGKPAVLWFWAPWCPTCLMQAKQVSALAADYDGKATVLGVAGLDTVPAMNEFVDTAEVSGFRHLADEQGLVWKRFGITAQSTFVVLDSAGVVVERGHVDVEKLPGMLDDLLTG